MNREERAFLGGIGALLVVVLGIGWIEGWNWFGDQLHVPAVPAGADTLVLRVRGVAGMGGPLEQFVPPWSVYGDGRVILATEPGGYSTGPEFTLREYHLTPAALRHLYAGAVHAGALHDHDWAANGVADEGGLLVQARSGVVLHSSYLTDGAGVGGAARLRGWDRDIRKLPATSFSAPAVDYRPARTAQVTFAATGWSCRILDDAQRRAVAARLAADPALGRDPQDQLRFVLRPLLPDEPGCSQWLR